MAEKKPIPIKQDLFSFITSRGIESISYEDKEQSFIKHPDISKSQFLNLKVGKANVKKKIEFTPLNSYLELREFNPSLFDLSTKIENLNSPEELNKELKPLNKEQNIKVWDYLFYELVEQKSPRNRKAVTQLIKTNNLVASLKTKDFSISSLVRKKILVPHHIIELIRLEFRECSKELIGVNEIGVIEFRKVEQEVCCYVPGEVSHIENVLAREYKEKHTRDLLRTEVTIESTSEVEIENITDISTTTRNELNSEIEQTLEEENSQNYGGSLSVSADWRKAKINANAYADFSNSNSSSQSNSVAKNFAQEVTRKAVEKIVRKTKLKRTSKILKEFETNNRHGFDNREGNEHVTGIYRWVDQIYTNRLINFGKRLVYKFTIPQPAEFYKMAINFKPKSDDGNSNGITPPKTLEQIGLTSSDILTEDNYQTFGSEYGVDLPEPQDDMISVSKHYSGNVEKQKAFQTTQPTTIPIPPDYVAKKVKGHYNFAYESSKLAGSWADFLYNIGSTEWGVWNLRSGGKKKSHSDSIDRNINNVTTVSVHFRYRSTHSYSISFTLQCYLKDEIKEEWQNEVYNKIKSAYEEKYAEYELKLEEKQASELERENQENNSSSNNPLDNRIVEQRELKRACIEMMMKPFCKKLGRDFTDERSCGGYKVPQTMQTKEYAEYIKYVAFFERAFDWDIMSYVFHPYYWAGCDEWVDLIQTKNADRIFQAFLQAGIAEVVVPVKCEMSLAVAYYIETGDILNSGDLVPEDLGDYYVSLAKEMEDCTEETTVEGTWDSRVPTSLTILQKDSALIEESGLPCCDRIAENGYENTLKAGDGKYKLLESKKSE